MDRKKGLTRCPKISYGATYDRGPVDARLLDASASDGPDWLDFLLRRLTVLLSNKYSIQRAEYAVAFEIGQKKC